MCANRGKTSKGKTRRDLYSRRLAQKYEELAALESQLNGTLSAVDELKLNNQVEDILLKIEQLEEKLAEFDGSAHNSNIRHLTLEKSFRKIDFTEAKKIAKSINTNLGDDSGAILLFLQRSTKQKGGYCLNEVFDLMVSDRKVGEDIIGDFRPYPVDLGSAISEFNELEFSKRLASHLTPDSEGGLNNSIKKLCSSLRGGSTIFIKVDSWDSVIDQEKFLDWFIKKFWHPLINELNPVFLEFSKIRFIVALVAKSKVLPDCSSLQPYFCTKDELDPFKAIELPLPNWEVDDIKQWLITCRGFSNSKSQKLAQQIYRESEGTPHTICSILEDKFK
ncbi:MAG: hypothetical protein F6K65_40300 [Moorea sp. SIO3C2]|nr:hypothetical protein [Moorena sp. SIO3C2]